ncbi:bifunctional DNA-binding transcriptional regulator/O6-methylguanine-DNA methyltransferase Ada [Acidocella aminolytica]|uniref:bifunctional DNA-binding transcriptional regulator/O6-methylguanine-DNA methyltransferase Ada n=1 Tax=Acidocella aminolytica TaxID=33998 RepID=UPI00091DBE64|nr:bifunctional DNA-binding transcriptional regulator/O6-methylguanine-DNA methyltransferase Ada [Acidocella aminolytica]SHF48750.1 AraC family transcriptional regulator, regulatory protein of adaptative response / methylated-DNA-[protein]-cysteine methyltransferase [Acidocella aminolytica 101 = DSM 11237]
MDTPTLASSYNDHRLFDRFAREAERWAALATRDQAADGAFFYAVRTTSVYCYPSCAARPALRENVVFFATRDEAVQAGFRPCKRCRPDLPSRAQREATLVAGACELIETASEAPSLSDLARAAGCSPHHFHRLFKRITGVTPKAYADAHRQSRVQAALTKGVSVTEALYDAGFNSSGRFYDATDAMLGMTPTAYRTGGAGEIIHHATGQSSLGCVLVAASARGICAILLGDEPDALIKDLAARFPRAEHRPGDAGFAQTVDNVIRLVDDPADNTAPVLPLDIRGTAFQRKVWNALRQIPPGRTLSYTELAGRIGAPRAARAVAAACAANSLAVAVPCHRVISANGDLAGYRWGLERKQRLLTREKS